MGFENHSFENSFLNSSFETDCLKPLFETATREFKETSSDSGKAPAACKYESSFVAPFFRPASPSKNQQSKQTLGQRQPLSRHRVGFDSAFSVIPKTTRG